MDIQFKGQSCCCDVDILSYTHVKGTFDFDAPSDVDFWGYVDLDFTILSVAGMTTEEFCEQQGLTEKELYNIIETEIIKQGEFNESNSDCRD